MAAFTLITLPLVVMWSGVNPARDRWIAYLIGGVIVTFAILFTIQTLGGFLRQKVSLLVWFLYLCTVEISPLCAVVLVVARNV
jgi:integral membrane sensor domain MASE1